MFQYCHYYFFSLLLLVLVKQNCSICRNYERTDGKLTHAEDHSLLLNSLHLDDLAVFYRVFNNILIPRVVGTANHTHVINHITNELKALGWTVEKDLFTSYTPLGQKSFENIIATPNPRASQYLDVACHFDSKLYENFVFVGATDSAVPCAMMIQLASSLNPFLSSNDELSLRLIFFDGEEAFVTWTDTDSLYGSRHLAKVWEKTPYKNGTALDRISLLVLLDLLGPPNPTFYSFFSETLPFYRMLVGAETKLNNCGLLSSYPRNYFRKMSTDSSIQDDHLPFLYRGVPILHIIPVPFPEVWHTADDSYDAIDFQTVTNLTKIFALFIMEYLGIA